MSNSNIYDADYFLRGKESGKSLYENYSWKPELTIPMVETILDHCGIYKSDHVLDFGCARGYTVKALRLLGYLGFGYDISKWAIDNCDPDVKNYVTLLNNTHKIGFKYDWIIAKDVLEHVEYVAGVIDDLMNCTNKGLFVVVPLSKFDKGKYVIEEYEKDITHIQRWTLDMWVSFFLRPGWSVQASYRMLGVKDNYYRPGWEWANGFLTVRKLTD